jgi:hypothetical protein
VPDPAYVVTVPFPLRTMVERWAYVVAILYCLLSKPKIVVAHRIIVG